MYDEVRGMHTCFICNRPMTWVAHLYGGSVIAHGSEIVGGVTASGGRDTNNQVPLEVKIVCPFCSANNSFKHQHTVQ